MRIKKLFLFLLKLCLAAVILTPAIYLLFCFGYVPYHILTSGWYAPDGPGERLSYGLGLFVWFFVFVGLLVVGPFLLTKIFPSLEKKEDGK